MKQFSGIDHLCEALGECPQAFSDATLEVFLRVYALSDVRSQDAMARLFGAVLAGHKNTKAVSDRVEARLLAVARAFEAVIEARTSPQADDSAE